MTRARLCARWLGTGHTLSSVPWIAWGTLAFAAAGAFYLLLLGRPLWRSTARRLFFSSRRWLPVRAARKHSSKGSWGRARPVQIRRLVEPIGLHQHRCPQPSANVTVLSSPATRHSASRSLPCFLASTGRSRRYGIVAALGFGALVGWAASHKGPTFFGRLCRATGLWNDGAALLVDRR
jgi:hypothetical protein